MKTDKLNVIMSEILAIPAEKVTHPIMPTNIYVQEVDDLYMNCQKDKDKLAIRGITIKKIKSLLPLAAALTEAESNWFIERDKKEKEHQKWMEVSGPAHELRNLILHDYRFGYRNCDDIMTKLKKVGEGHSHSDMIQDLSKLIALGKEYPEELSEMNFDLTLLEEAQVFVDTLGLIYSASKAEDNCSETKDIRDRVFTCLSMIVNDIRAAGQNLFWRTPERLKHYRSAYRHNMNVKRERRVKRNSLAA